MIEFSKLRDSYMAGREVGASLAARGLQRRTRDLIERYQSGEIDPATLEQELEAARVRGMGRLHDLTDETKRLREQADAYRNRQDARGIATALGDGRPVDAYQLARSMAARIGDTNMAQLASERLDALDAAGRVEAKGGKADFSGAYGALRDAALRRGDIEGAAAADTKASDMLDVWAANVLGDANRQIDSGNLDGGLAIINTVLNERGMPIQLLAGNEDDGLVHIADAQGNWLGKSIDRNSLTRYLADVAQSGRASLQSAIAKLTEQDEANTKWQDHVRKSVFDAAVQLIRDAKLPQSVASATADATVRLGQSGIKSINYNPENGTATIAIGGRLIEQRPAPVDPNAVEGSDTPTRAFDYFLAGTNTRVDPNELAGADVTAALNSVGAAYRMADNNGAIDLMQKFIGTQLATLSDIAYNELGGSGESPRGRAIRNAISGEQTADAESIERAVDAFSRVVDRLEGTGDNPASSAQGRYQFIDDTLRGVIKKYFPDTPQAELLSSMREGSKEEVAYLQELKKSPFIEDAFRALTSENANRLVQAGYDPNPLNLYMLHHFGPSSGLKMVAAYESGSLDAPVKSIVTSRQMKANSYLNKYPTVGALVSHWVSRQPELVEDRPVSEVERMAQYDQKAEAPAAAAQPTVAAQNQLPVSASQQLLERLRELDRMEQGVKGRMAREYASSATFNRSGILPPGAPVNNEDAALLARIQQARRQLESDLKSVQEFEAGEERARQLAQEIRARSADAQRLEALLSQINARRGTTP